MSQTRLVAAKSANKKSASTPPKARVEAVGGGKPKSASIPPVAPVNGGAQADRTRTGVSKNELKAQFAKLSTATGQIGALKRALNKSFFDIGVLLNQIRNERLYEVKGYGSFESFVEREIDINKAICLKLTRIAEALQRDQALGAGLERASAAIAALDGETETAAAARPVGSPAGGVPLHKQ